MYTHTLCLICMFCILIYLFIFAFDARMNSALISLHQAWMTDCLSLLLQDYFFVYISIKFTTKS